MIIAIIFFVLIVGIVILSIQNKENQEKEQARLAIKSAIARHAQIINESMGIVRDTKNLKTLVSRVAVALNNMDEIESLQSKFGEMTEKPISNTRVGFMEFANDRIADLAIEDFDLFMAKHQTYKSKSAATNAASKAAARMVEYREALLIAGANYDKYLAVINGQVADIEALSEEP